MAYTCSCGIPDQGSSLLLQRGVEGVNRYVYPPPASGPLLQLCLVMKQFPQPRASHNQDSANFPDSIIFLINFFLSHCGGATRMRHEEVNFKEWVLGSHLLPGETQELNLGLQAL